MAAEGLPACLQRDGALDSLNLEVGSRLTTGSPKAGLDLDLGSLLRQPSLDGSTGARDVLKRSLAGTSCGAILACWCNFHLHLSNISD